MTQQYCYIHVRGQKPGQRIGIAKYLDSGYYPTDSDPANSDASLNSEECVEIAITALNRKLGVTPTVREAMEAGSMFGWRVPAAIPALKHFGAPEIDPEEEKLITPELPKETEINAGPCLTCGHPPRCHPKRQCDSSSYTPPCGEYIPNPKHILKVKVLGGTNA